MSFIRRIASLFFVLAFIAGTNPYAMAAMPMAKSDTAMAGMMHGPDAGNCRGCTQDGSVAKADCKATCTAAFALAPDSQVEKETRLDILWARGSDTALTREIAPDTTPPRS